MSTVYIVLTAGKYPRYEQHTEPRTAAPPCAVYDRSEASFLPGGNCVIYFSVRPLRSAQ